MGPRQQGKKAYKEKAVEACPALASSQSSLSNNLSF